MDIEFHYHMTYLIAAKAGLSPADALILAHACQMTDDNDKIFEINTDTADFYSNYISQTIDVTKPKGGLFRIYVLFHFIPGDPLEQGAARKDGLMHCLNTTPASQNARDMAAAALAAKDIYRLGIACHAFADTFAHQNFVGYYTSFNGLTGPLEKVTPNIGHADARHDPDRPALVWEDKRLMHEQIDNTGRFLAAAMALFGLLAASTGVANAQTLEKELLEDLRWAIGDPDAGNRHVAVRQDRYKVLARRPAYGGLELPEYNPHQWLDEAVHEDVRGLSDKRSVWPFDFTVFPDVFTWKNPAQHRESHWYRFQEAIKNHQKDVMALLMPRNLSHLTLPEF